MMGSAKALLRYFRPGCRFSIVAWSLPVVRNFSTFIRYQRVRRWSEALQSTTWSCWMALVLPGNMQVRYLRAASASKLPKQKV